MKALHYVRKFLRSLAEMAHQHLFGYMTRVGMILQAVTLPNGSTISIASGYGAVKSMTALSNASEGVATLEASHGVVENDIIELTSGWARLNQKIVRADSVSTNDVTLENINTSNTTYYPTGTGTGSIREISGWTQVQQILQTASQGGEAKTVTYQFLEAQSEVEFPIGKAARKLELTIADDPSLAGYIACVAADDDGLCRAFKIVLPNGSTIYENAYVSVGDPTLDVNQVMAVKVTLAFLNTRTRYDP